MIMQKVALSRFSALTMYTARRQLQNKKALLSIESKAGNVKISRKRIRSLLLDMYVHYPASPFLEGFTANNKAGLLTYAQSAYSGGTALVFHQTSLFTQSLN